MPSASFGEPQAGAAAPNSRKPDEWEEQARNLIKGAMATRGYSFKKLAGVLDSHGLPIGEKALALRINRGTFTLSFALQLLRVMGETELSIKHVAVGRSLERTSKLMGGRGNAALDGDEE
jgi:hypothetical protein